MISKGVIEIHWAFLLIICIYLLLIISMPCASELQPVFTEFLFCAQLKCYPFSFGDISVVWWKNQVKSRNDFRVMILGVWMPRTWRGEWIAFPRDWEIAYSNDSSAVRQFLQHNRTVISMTTGCVQGRWLRDRDDATGLAIAIFTLLKPDSGINGEEKEKILWKLNPKREKPLTGWIPSG